MPSSLPQQSPIVQDPANAKLRPFEKDQLQDHLERFGHPDIYKHDCPACDTSWDCHSRQCHKPKEDYCRKCSVAEFISDTKRLCDTVASHMRLSAYDPVISTHMGYLEGLVKRAAELEVWVDE